MQGLVRRASCRRCGRQSGGAYEEGFFLMYQNRVPGPLKEGSAAPLCLHHALLQLCGLCVWALPRVGWHLRLPRVGGRCK